MKVDDSKLRPPSEGLRRKRVEEDAVGPGSVFSEDTRPEIKYIAPDKIVPYHGQARLQFSEEDLNSLSQTIKKHGIRQPLTVIASEAHEGKFEVVSGERRLRAAIIAGLHQVPCIILRDTSKAHEIALIENLQRKDLHPIELGIAYRQLLEKKICKTQKEIAEMLGVQRTHVVEMIAAACLPTQVQHFFLKNNIRNRELLREMMHVEIPKLTEETAEDYRELQKVFQRILESKKKKNKTEEFKNKKLMVGIYFGGGALAFTENIMTENSEITLLAVKAELKNMLSLVEYRLNSRSP